MHLTLDGFAGKENGEMDWMTNDWSQDLHRFTIQNLDDVDFIMIPFGRKMDDSFFSYWGSTAAKPADPFFEVARKIMDTPKVVLSRYPVPRKFPNTRIIEGDLLEQVRQFKQQEGRHMMVYGGVRFASSLIEHDLVDEYCILSNPVAIGKGLPIFAGVGGNMLFELIRSEPDACGIIVNKYIRRKI
jgi:dihydrofolate reductase